MTQTNDSWQNVVIASKILFFDHVLHYRWRNQWFWLFWSSSCRYSIYVVNTTSLVAGHMLITSSWSRKRDGLIEFNEFMNFQVGEECFESVIWPRNIDKTWHVNLEDDLTKSDLVFDTEFLKEKVWFTWCWDQWHTGFDQVGSCGVSRHEEWG